MSRPLSEVDRELLGETEYNNGAETTMAKANGGPGLEAHEEFPGTAFTPLNATAGTLVKVTTKGHDVETGKEKQDNNVDNTKPAPKTPKKRGAAASANDDSTQPTKKRSPVKKATAATNAEAHTNGEAVEPVTPSTKKRASPKKKDTVDVNAKIENGETNGETEGPEPVTPKKGKRAPAKGKATKAENGTKVDDEPVETTEKTTSPTKGNGDSDTTVKDTPRKRQAPKKELAAPRGIPSSWDDADHADRMMVMMKERGDGWAEIRAAWKQVTGQDTASRYALPKPRR